MEKEALKIKWWIFPLDAGRLFTLQIKAECPAVCQVDNGKGVTLVLSLTLFPSSSLLTSIKGGGKVHLPQRSAQLICHRAWAAGPQL